MATVKLTPLVKEDRYFMDFASVECYISKELPNQTRIEQGHNLLLVGECKRGECGIITTIRLYTSNSLDFMFAKEFNKPFKILY